MNELESILNYLETTSLEPHDDYTSEFTYKEQKVLWEYIKQLEWENQKLKKQLEVGKEQYNDVVEEKENLQEQLSNSHQIKAQQKEFIEWLEDSVRTLEMLDKTFTLKNYKNEIRIYKEILSKYKEIIGGKHE